MTVFTQSYQLASAQSLMQALATNGIFDAIFNVTHDYDTDGNDLGTCTVTVTTNIGSQAQFDAVVLDTEVGSFFSEKAAKIKAIQDQSVILSNDGAYFTRPSDGATNKGPLEISFDARSELFNLIEDVKNGLVPMPQMIDTADGRGAIAYNQADAQAAYQAIIDRGVYILNAGQNADLSFGENGYIQQITQAPDQTALDAITDTRT